MKPKKPRAVKPKGSRSPAAPQAPAGPKPGEPRVFLISETLALEVLQYVQNVPSGNMAGGVLIKLFAGLQQLPEVYGDGRGTFYMKQPMPPGRQAQPQAPAPIPPLAPVPNPPEGAE